MDAIINKIRNARGKATEVTHLLYQLQKETRLLLDELDKLDLRLTIPIDKIEPLKETEKRAILCALKAYSNRRDIAARQLQIGERTLYRKIKEYNL